ncbi:MAG: transposase [Bryobacteraceae bacterium]
MHHAKVFGRCESTTGIVPFSNLVDQVMSRPPYNDARRVFWIVDNGSSHRGAASVACLQAQYPRLVLIHSPVHASWLNQIEIYFSIIQRKVLTPNNFTSLDQLAERLFDIQYYWQATAQPFEWKCSKADLAKLLAKLKRKPDLTASRIR